MKQKKKKEQSNRCSMPGTKQHNLINTLVILACQCAARTWEIFQEQSTAMYLKNFSIKEDCFHRKNPL